MIYDIKVFDNEGNLKEIINGQKIYEKIYEEDFKMVHRRTKARKKQRKLTCPYCKVVFFTARDNQYICGSKECSHKRSNTYGNRRYDNSERKFKCRICNIKVITKHPLQVTCLSDQCKKENNKRQNLINGHRRVVKQRRKEKNERDREIGAGEREAVQGTGNNGKTDKTAELETG